MVNLTTNQINQQFMNKNEYVADMNNTLDIKDKTNAQISALVNTYIATNVTPNKTTLDNYILQIQENIAELKNSFDGNLLVNIGEIDNNMNSSSQLIKDQRFLYNKAYLQNFSMLVGISFTCLFLVKGFRN
jgi:hypothetical protein